MREHDILAQLLAIEDAAELDRFLQRHPAVRPELEAFLRLSAVLKELPHVEATAEFKQRTQALLLPQGSQPATWGRFNRLLQALGFGALGSALLRPVAAVAATLLVFVVVATGTVAAAERSLPGGSLYSVKLGVEEMRLTFTGSPEMEARLRLNFASRRLQEALALLQSSGSATEPTIVRATQAVNDALQALSALNEFSPAVVGDLRAVALGNEPIHDELARQAAASDDSGSRHLLVTLTRARMALASLAYDPSLLASAVRLSDAEVEASTIELKGVVVVTGTSVTIAGVPLDLSLLGVNPASLSGRTVEVEGVWRNGILLVLSVESEGASQDKAEAATIEAQGVVVVTGTSVTIAGVPLDLSLLRVSPASLNGRTVKVEGVWRNGVLLVTEIGGDEDEAAHGSSSSEYADERSASSEDSDDDEDSKPSTNSGASQARSVEIEGVLVVSGPRVTVAGTPVDLSLLGVNPATLNGLTVKVEGVWKNGVVQVTELEKKEGSGSAGSPSSSDDREGSSDSDRPSEEHANEDSDDDPESDSSESKDSDDDD